MLCNTKYQKLRLLDPMFNVLVLYVRLKEESFYSLT
jgi:hypothetical protein